MLVNYKCPHSRSFGPNNLSLIVWLFHSTRRMWRMWTGDTQAWMSGRASAHRLNFSFNLSLTWAKLQHASIFFFFLSLRHLWAGLKSTLLFRRHTESKAEPLPSLSAPFREERGTDGCTSANRLTHFWLLFQLSHLLPFHSVLYAAKRYFHHELLVDFLAFVLFPLILIQYNQTFQTTQ